MHSINVLNRLLSSYSPKLRSKKWWWNLFSNALNMAVATTSLRPPQRHWSWNDALELQIGNPNFSSSPENGAHHPTFATSTQSRAQDRMLDRKKRFLLFHFLFSAGSLAVVPTRQWGSVAKNLLHRQTCSTGKCKNQKLTPPIPTICRVPQVVLAFPKRYMTTVYLVNLQKAS